MALLKFTDWWLQQSQSFSSQFPWQRLWHACTFTRGREANPFHFHCSKILLLSIYSRCPIDKHYIKANLPFLTAGKTVFREGFSAFYKTFSLRLHEKIGASVCCYLTMAITAAPAPARAQTNKWNVMLSWSKNTSQHALVFNTCIPNIWTVWHFLCIFYWFVALISTE